jgi:hypothetical protein
MEERIIILASIERLRVHPQNQATSKISFKVVERLMESMRMIGFETAHPILVMRDPDNEDIFLILDGRHRYLAAQGLGLKEVPILVLPPVSLSEQMTAITATNTLVNAVHRQLPKGKRVINAYRLALNNPDQSEALWSLAKVNKTDWFRAKNLLAKAIQDAKKAMPQAKDIEIIERMIMDPKISPKIYALYHREDAWQDLFGTVQKRTQPDSLSIELQALPSAITALSDYVRERQESEKSPLKDPEIKALLLLAKKETKDSQKAKVILRRLCDVVSAALRHDMELGGSEPGALF